MSAKIHLISGTGNRFAILDAVTQPAPRDPSALALALCARDQPGPRLDGLLLVLSAHEGGDVRMQLYNADGTDSETCGNGLRCVAKFAVDRGLVPSRTFVVEDASGLHTAFVEPATGPIRRAVVSMRRPRLHTRDERVELADPDGVRVVTGSRVDVGNQHFVVLVDDVIRAAVERDGSRIENHAAFPAGTNVEFVAHGAERTDMRVWERGVGETEACGSGACAVAATLVAIGVARLPLDLHLPGGVLRIGENADGSYSLAGAVEDLGQRDWPRTHPAPHAAG